MEENDSSLSFMTGWHCINNAFDLLNSSVRMLQTFEERSYNYNDNDLKPALISASTAVELLLKAKIVVKNWKSLFQDVEKANKVNFISGDFFSINLENCFKRIEEIYPLKIEPSLIKRLKTIRKVRNKIVHFHYGTDKAELISLVSECIDIFIEFYRAFIFKDFYEEKDRTLGVDHDLKNVKAYVNVRMETISQKLKLSKRPKTYHLSECFNCDKDAYIIEDKTLKCLFCQNSLTIKEFASDISERENLVKVCMECGYESLIVNCHGDNNWECIICGFFTETPTRFIISDTITTNNSLRLDI